MEEVKFTKMHGIGNDYIYIDCRHYCPRDLPSLSVEMSRPHYGVGADGIITIENSSVADFKMRIFNADGSEAKMCGNGCRCVGKYVFDKGLANKTDITVETLSGIKRLRLHINRDSVESVTVDMGEPSLEPSQIPVIAPSGKTSMIEVPVVTSVGSFLITAISMGNPHGVAFVDDLSAIDLHRAGREIELNPMWPDRANIEFAQVLSHSEIAMRVWERGSGETMACGTGACATAVAAAITGRARRDVILKLSGGDLRIRWNPDDNHVYMTGGAEMVFDGVYTKRCR